MDKQRRGALLADKEQCENEIRDLEAKLAHIGSQFEQLGRDMRHHPDSVQFLNAPSGLGNNELGTTHLPAFDWRTVGDLNAVAKSMKSLRDHQRKLARIEGELKG